MADVVRMNQSGVRGEGAGDLARRKGHFIGTPVTRGMTDDQVLDAPLSVFNELVEAAGVPVQYADVRAASSLDDGNITLSGEQTIGINVSSGDPGIDVVDGDRVLLTYQDAAAENGLWIVVDGGTWTRPTDFDGAGEAVTGATVQVLEGSQTGLWRLTTQGTITIDATAQTWRAFSLRNAEKVSFSAGGAGATPQSVGERIRASTVHLMDYVPKSQWAAIEAGSSAFDATVAMARAAEMGKRVILPAGEALVNFDAIASGFVVEGEDRIHSILRPFNPDAIILKGDSGDVASFIHGLHLSNFSIYGTVEDDGFLEYADVIHLAGLQDALIENLIIKGPRSDGILIQGALEGSDLGDPSNFRHNSRVRISGCTFDGINRNNRNAISVIDGDGIDVVDCSFLNFSRNGDPTYVSGPYDVMDPTKGRGMPGPIDIEPNPFAPYFLRDINIVRPRFRDCGGNVAQIGIVVPADVVTPPSGITVEDLDTDGYVGLGCDFFMRTFREVDDESPNMAVRLSGWRGTNGGTAVRVSGVKGLTIRDMVLEDYTGDITLGLPSSTEACRDVLLDNVKMIRCGTVTSTGITVGNADQVVFTKVTLDDVGPSGAGGIGVLLLSGATSSGIVMRDCMITSPNNLTTFAVINQGGAHTQSAATNRIFNCDFGGRQNDLKIGNQRGTAELVAGTVTVTCPGMMSTSMVRVSRMTVGGTPGHLSVGTITAGTSFELNSSTNSDTSTLFYEVVPVER